MKKLLNFSIIFCLSVFCQGCHRSPWTLVWEENFDENCLDTSVWERVPRGTPDWQNTQTAGDTTLSFVKDGLLTLVGKVNEDPSDSIQFVTGGVWGRGLKRIKPGRIEVCARMGDARGAWPAIWTLGFDESWPQGGEIDLCERLNGDDFAYQTVHSPYTLTHKPHVHGTTGPINHGEFNIYGVDMYPDSLVMHINGVPTLHYLRDPEIPAEDGQFPYFKDVFLLLDMQLGGSWVGDVTAEDLPVTMEIDWVRCYTRNDRN